MTIQNEFKRVCFNRRSVHTPTLVVAGERMKKVQSPRTVRQAPFHLLHQVTSGSGTVSTAAGQQTRVAKGDWFFCFPGQEIFYEQDPADPWLHRWIGFHGGDSTALLGRANIFPTTLVLHAELDETIVQHHRSILEILDRSDAVADLEANALLMRILVHLIRTHGSPEPRDEPMRHGGAEDFIDGACQFMIEHYPDGITAADVSAHIGFERSYFSKVFSEKLGTTIRDYLADLRVTKAKALLIEDDLDGEGIAQAVGLGDAKTFVRFFKNRIGSSPGRWRRESPG